MIDIDKINDAASNQLIDLLEKFYLGEISEEDVLSITYGSMVAASAMGYILADMATEAEAAADKWLVLLEQQLASEDLVDDT